MPTNWHDQMRTANGAACIVFNTNAQPTKVDLALSAAYTYASVGPAIGFSFIPSETGDLTDFWFRVASYTGTWASATDQNINYEIRADLNGTLIPGTTLVASGTITLDGSTLGWIKVSGLSIALTACKLYWLILGDANGGATNFVTLARNNGVGVAYAVIGACSATTTGFASGNTNVSGGYCVIKQAGSLYAFNTGIDAFTTLTNNTVERGVKFRVPNACTYMGLAINTDNAAIFKATAAHRIKLYADGNMPGGATLSDFTVPVQSGTGTSPVPLAMMLPKTYWVDLFPDRFYRCAIDPAAALTIPRQGIIAGNPDADVLAAFLPFGGNYIYTVESGGVWGDGSGIMFSMSPLLVPGHYAQPSFNMGL